MSRPRGPSGSPGAGAEWSGRRRLTVIRPAGRRRRPQRTGPPAPGARTRSWPRTPRSCRPASRRRSGQDSTGPIAEGLSMPSIDSDNRVRVLIISPDGAAAEKAREIGEKLLNKPKGTMLAKALSPTGTLPATHWLCENLFAREVFEKMLAHPRQLGTEIVDGREGTTEEILARRGLKAAAV